MRELVLIDGRWMQRQPCQQQQGGGGKSSSTPQPAPIPAPPPPTIVNTQQQQDDVQTALNKRNGALANDLTGPTGAALPTVSTATPSPGTAKLLG